MPPLCLRLCRLNNVIHKLSRLGRDGGRRTLEPEALLLVLDPLADARHEKVAFLSIPERQDRLRLAAREGLEALQVN